MNASIAVECCEFRVESKNVSKLQSSIFCLSTKCLGELLLTKQPIGDTSFKMCLVACSSQKFHFSVIVLNTVELSHVRTHDLLRLWRNISGR